MEQEQVIQIVSNNLENDRTEIIVLTNLGNIYRTHEGGNEMLGLNWERVIEPNLN